MAVSGWNLLLLAATERHGHGQTFGLGVITAKHRKWAECSRDTRMFVVIETRFKRVTRDPELCFAILGGRCGIYLTPTHLSFASSSYLRIKSELRMNAPEPMN
jgi:hypothetical protein